jgi:VanZ family protein
MVLIAVLSLLPARLFPPSDASIPGLDKLVHLAMYGFLGVLLRWEASREGGRTAGSWRLAGAIGYGLLMEVFQLLVGGGRMFSWGDAAANAAGVLLFWAGAGWLFAAPKRSGPG